MKTAGDVVNRIQWDEEIEKEFITVGYIDRFLGLKECAFNTFDWGDIVLADLGSLAIPEHRISYFKYKNELVWDKSTRLDNVFGSTGSNTTIHDVIKRLANKAFTSERQVEDESDEVNRVGRIRKNEIKEEPNYFLSIPVVGDEIKRKFSLLRDELVKSNPNVEDLILPETSLHLTLCTLRIDQNDEIENVKRILQNLASDSKFLSDNFPISVRFQGVGEFFNKVMYISCQTDDQSKLENIKKIVLEKLKEEGISTAGNYYDFTPHMTVFKIKNNNSSTSKASKNNFQKTVGELVSKELWQKYNNFEFGEMKVEELELCKMVNIFNCLTYPIEFTIRFK